MNKNTIDTNLIGITNKLNELVGILKGKKETKTQKLIAKKLEIDEGNFSKALKGNTDYLTIQFITKFSEVFGFDVDMIINSDKEIKNFSEKKSELTTISKDVSKKPIPYYNVDFAGGWSSEEIFSQGSPDFYINNPEFDRSEFACNLVGNSISRRIPNGSIIGLKLIDDWQTYFPTNELYGVVMKNDLRTVKIVKRSKNKGFLILIPDPLPQYNQIQYEEEEVPIDFISKFYQITAWAQFERLAQ